MKVLLMNIGGLMNLNMMRSLRFIVAGLLLTSLIGLTTGAALAASTSPGCAGFMTPVTALYAANFTGNGPFYAGETLTIVVTTPGTTFSLLVGGVVVIATSPTPNTFTYKLTANAANFQFNAGMNIMARVSCTPVGGSGGATRKGGGVGRAEDDRLDRRWGMPLASYCRNNGFHFYLIDENSRGILRLIVSREQIDAVPEKPEHNTLIAESEEKIRLYRLTTGEFQVNYGPNTNGDEYAWSWITCVPDAGTDQSFNIYHT